LKIADFTVEKFAEWKLSLQRRKYSAESINHFLSAVRAMFNFAEDTEVINKAPKLKRVRNEPRSKPGSKEKPIYSSADISKLTEKADFQMKIMIMLALNCGFGPKDLHDLTWDDIDGNRVTLPRCKTGVCQTYLLWPELQQLLECIRQKRKILEKRTSLKTLIFKNHNHVFLTKFGHPWNKDALSEQFRKLCNKAGVPCYGFYRLRHCASTAMSLVASPHVHRKFMRHSQLQQQVTYTHTPDVEVNKAVMKAREKLFGKHCLISNEERSQELEKVV
jgi:integrase